MLGLWHQIYWVFTWTMEAREEKYSDRAAMRGFFVAK
jgi:hypothetical protein